MTTSATTGFAWTTEIAKRNRHEISVNPESSPSSPSMKLIAFIMPTYQNSVSGIDSQSGKSIQLVCGL